MKIRVAYTGGEQDKKKLLEEAAKALFPDTKVKIGRASCRERV